jgi:hypothetical protein
VLADFNGDGKPDLLRFNSVWTNNGTGTFTLKGDVLLFSYVSSYAHVRPGDFNGDGKLDLITYQGPDLQVWLGNGVGGFTRLATSNRLERLWGKIGVGDFNRDGELDAVVYVGESYETNTVLVLSGKGDGSFTNITGYARYGYDRAYLRTADVNLDGASDVVVAGMYLQQAQVFLAVSNRLSNSVTSGTNTYGNLFELADVNGDGFPDMLFLASDVYPATVLRVQLSQGDGKFTNTAPVTLTLTGSVDRQFAVGDYNGDLKPDLAVVNTDSANSFVTIFTNYSDLSPASPRLTLCSRAPDVLSWPVLSNGFFKIEFRTSLNTNTSWQTLSSMPVRHHTTWYSTNWSFSPRGFYRLRRN